MKVEDVMTREVATVDPSTPLKDVARTLVEKGISGLPVVESDGRVVGVISEADVLAKERREAPRRRALARLLHLGAQDGGDLKLDARTAGEAMTSPPITVETFWSVTSAAECMIRGGVKRLPVLRDGRLVGIVTRTDLVRAFARSDDEIAAQARDQVALQQAMWGASGGVDVRLDAGEATLSGTVRRPQEAEMLERLVRGIPGVVGVRSELSVSEAG